MKLLNLWLAILIGATAHAFPLESASKPLPEVEQPDTASNTYITVNSFSEYDENLSENKGIKTNQTLTKYQLNGPASNFEYELEPNIHQVKQKPVTNEPGKETTELPPMEQEIEPKDDKEQINLPLEAGSPNQTSLEETKQSKSQVKAVGTMPRYGRAFGPLPPPSIKKESRLDTAEPIEDLPKSSAGVAHSEHVQDVSDKAESSKIEPLTNAPQEQQYTPYPRPLPPPPPSHYSDKVPYHPNSGYGPPLEQAFLPPPIPYYSQIKLNDSITRVDFLLSYDVRSEGPIAAERFGSQEKTQDGLIQGEYGFHISNGGIRGVRYTADPDVHPQLLYETLIKFLAL